VSGGVKARLLSFTVPPATSCALLTRMRTNDTLALHVWALMVSLGDLNLKLKSGSFCAIFSESVSEWWKRVLQYPTNHGRVVAPGAALRARSLSPAGLLAFRVVCGKNQPDISVVILS